MSRQKKEKREKPKCQNDEQLPQAAEMLINEYFISSRGLFIDKLNLNNSRIFAKVISFIYFPPWYQKANNNLFNRNNMHKEQAIVSNEETWVKGKPVDLVNKMQ